MMGHRRREFEAWLERWLATVGPETRLEAQRRLAQRWGMSPTTVNRLLRPYIASGRLRSAAGAGMVVGKGSDRVVEEATAGEGRVPGSTTIGDRLLEAIAASVWCHGDALPPQRALAQMFGVGRTRIAQGLRDLEERGLIHRQGRRLVVGVPGRQDRRQALPGRLLLVGEERQISGGVFSGAIPHIEDECYRQRISVHQHRLDELCSLLSNPGALQRVRGVLAFCPDDFDFDSLFAHWQRILDSSVGQSLRMVIGGPLLPASEVPARCDVLPRGSFHTRIGRRAAAVAAAMRPAAVQVLHDGRHPGQLKTLLRILPELDHRLPRTPWQFLVVDPTGGRVRTDYVRTVVQAGGRRGPEYYRGLLGQYRPMRLEELFDNQRSINAAADLHLPAGSLTIVENVDVAAWLADRGLLDRKTLGSDAGLLVLDDRPPSRLRGWASCSIDWRSTAHAIVHALLADLPVERSSRGYLRPHTRFLPRDTVPLSAW